MIEFLLKSRTLYMLIGSNNSTGYYLTDRGQILGIPIGLDDRARADAISKARPKQLRIKHQSEPVACFDIRNGNQHREIVIKIAVIESFTRYKVNYSSQIQHKDNNPLNCSINNLVLYSEDEAKKFRKGRKIILHFKNGRAEKFSNMSSAARMLYVDRKTLASYIEGKTQNSCIEDQVEKIETEEDCNAIKNR